MSVIVNIDKFGLRYGEAEATIRLEVEGAEYIADVMAQEYRRSGDTGALQINKAINKALLFGGEDQ